jgi:ABC-type Fe3+ transport system permease subunit
MLLFVHFCHDACQAQKAHNNVFYHLTNIVFVKSEILVLYYITLEINLSLSLSRICKSGKYESAKRQYQKRERWVKVWYWLAWCWLVLVLLGFILVDLVLAGLS